MPMADAMGMGMRLICPDCGAQYEIDDGTIPDAGRDVQCSSCGRVWFQKSQPMLLSDHEAVSPIQLGNTPVAGEPMGFGPRDPSAPVTFAEDPDPEILDEFGSTLQDSPQNGLGPALKPARALDDSLLAILREEADRETRARRGANAPLETQEEMPLAPPPVAPKPNLRPEPDVPAGRGLSGGLRGLEKIVHTAQAVRPAPVPAPTQAPEPIAAPTPTADRVPLPKAPLGPDRPPIPAPSPDLQAMGASLRASTDRAEDPIASRAPHVIAQTRSGFRLGFISVMAVAALAVAIYGFAPYLSHDLPAIAAPLDSYVAGVNDARLWLDVNLRDVLSSIQAMIRG